MGEFINFCNANTGFLTALFACLSFLTTLVYVGATIFILKANEKSAKMAEQQLEQSQKAMQKSIDLQLYDRRLEIANKIEKNDYTSSTAMEVYTLFGRPIYEKMKHIQKLRDYLEFWKNKRETYVEILKTTEYDFLLEGYAQDEYASPELLARAEEQDQKFQVVYEEYTDHEGNLIEYDIREIGSNIISLEEDIAKGDNELKKEVFKLLKDKISLEVAP